jgi:hypothetical protein
VPAVIVSREPAELIVTDGEPRLDPIEGTTLQAVANTDSDLFFENTDERFYFLAAGRWFRAAQLEGPWAAATLDLPASFASIPPDHPRGHVLASVPGTREAEAAVLLATIPRTATLHKSDLSVDVVYDGEPQFLPIEGSTGVASAVNTDRDVFLVRGGYYCCYEGVWFSALEPRGPWEVCEAVPAPIYSIPSYSPQHDVTYVTIEGTTPDTVTVAQTSGYSGDIVAFGLILAGVGLAFANADSVNVNARISLGNVDIVYGSRARYSMARGGYQRGGGAYGPYGGARARGVDRRAAGSSFVRSASPYSAWGGSVVARDRATSRRGASSFGASARRRGAGGSRGDLYAGPSGNVYRRGADGSWQERTGRDWRGIDSDAAKRAQRASLDRQYQARSFGTRQARSASRGRGGRGGRGR